jgi:hypothetical protein
MLFLTALAAAVIVGVVLWKAMTGHAPSKVERIPPRPAAPDDDPEFLRQLSERVRRAEGEDPPRGR